MSHPVSPAPPLSPFLSSSSSSSSSSSFSSSSSISSSSSAASLVQEEGVSDSSQIIGSIFKKNDTDEQAIEKCRGIFFAHGVLEDHVRVMDVTDDYELQKYLNEVFLESSNEYPLISIRNTPVGNFHRFLEIEQKNPEEITRYLSATQKSSLMELGYVDSLLNAGEYVVSTVSAVLFSPVHLASWLFYKNEEGKVEESVDFEVIHTNWYWRHLKRTFRFGETEILRIHPNSKEIRARHAYSSLECIRVAGPCNIVLEYSDGSSPDYIQATSDAVFSMIKLILSKVPLLPILKPRPSPFLRENVQPYEQKRSFEHRKKVSMEVERLNPNRIAVILGAHEKEKALPLLRKRNLLFGKKTTIGHCASRLRQIVDLMDDEVVVLFTCDGSPLPHNALVSDVFEAQRKEDGILYLLLSVRLKQFS